MAVLDRHAATTQPTTAEPIVESTRMSPATVAGLLAGAVIAVHLLRGPNYVLDDWWVAGEAVVDGPLGASSRDLVAARPGTLLAYGATFGLFARHPLIVTAIHGAVFVSVAMVLAVVVG